MNVDFVRLKYDAMKKQLAIRDEKILDKIYVIDGEKIMLDSDLAFLYKVETKRLKEAVRRNRERFPKDFMFELNKKQLEILRTQIASSSWGGSRYKPMAFTELGVAMLSSILNSRQAIQVNIQIIRIFTRIRKVLASHKELIQKINQLENRTYKNDEDIKGIFRVLKQLLNPPSLPRKKIGFKSYD
jgi:hypothetical protein